jgi:hypothetical protein
VFPWINRSGGTTMKLSYLALAFAAMTLTAAPALSESTNPPKSGASSESPADPSAQPQGKTSDRTPGDPSPDRTPNATSKGAVGTDAAKTPEGTSDRTPTTTQKPSDN